MLILSIPRAAAGNRTQDLFLTKEVLYRLSYSSDTDWRTGNQAERAMGFEPTTSCLEGKSSTTELHPRVPHSAFVQSGRRGIRTPEGRSLPDLQSGAIVHSAIRPCLARELPVGIEPTTYGLQN